MSTSLAPDGVAAKLVGNVLGLMLLVLGLAFVGDWIANRFGFHPALVCTALPYVQVVLGHTAAVAIGGLAFIGWAFSGFRASGPLLLLVGALLIGAAPGVIAHYLGAGSCHGGCPSVAAASRGPAQDTISDRVTQVPCW